MIAGDCREILPAFSDHTFDSVVTDPPYELGFMGKKWDSTGIAYDVAMWAEVLRVLKPGAYLLAFGGTRTYHRMTCAIEDAGFEIRDCIQWLYGTGFPKSLNVVKALECEQHATHAAMLGHVADYCPECEQPFDSAANDWAGWGTALKPANEPIVLARKPLVGTVAANIREFRTGALDIDHCRIAVEGEVIHAPQSDPTKRAGTVGTALGITGADKDRFQAAQRASIQRTQELGRWPANVLLDEEAAAVLDEQSGLSTSRRGKPRAANKSGDGWGMTATGAEHADSGGASRFFYVAKPSRAERDAGVVGGHKTGGELTNRTEGSAGLANPRAGAGRTSGGKNTHPTVKPITLLRYLVRLVTPVGGTVLDPFTGSGSTGAACVLEGLDFTGIELSDEYADLALQRIEHHKEHVAAA